MWPKRLFGASDEAIETITSTTQEPHSVEGRSERDAADDGLKRGLAQRHLVSLEVIFISLILIEH